VNFEKPYTAKLEGVSTVIKSRPPSFTGEKRKTRGYPAITATVVNLKQPAVSYAQCGNASGGCPGGFVIRAVVGRQYYRPYGGPRGAAVALPTDRAFTGQYRDATGLDFYNARYYSSTLGRFVSADTIVPEPGNPQALNRYSYVYNSPLKYTDPSGHCPICLIIGIGVALVVWLANPEPVYAPEPGWTPPPEADPNYGDKAFFDAAPGTGDISDAYAAVTGRTLFTGEEVDPGGRAFAATAAVIPLFSSGAFRQGRKFIQGIDNIVPGASTTVRRITGPLSDPLKDALRREARDIFFNANPGLSRDLQVHHRVPLE